MKTLRKALVVLVAMVTIGSAFFTSRTIDAISQENIQAETVKIDSQTTLVTRLQEKRSEINNQLNSLERENQLLEIDILESEREKINLENQLNNLESELDRLINSPSSQGNVRQNLDSEIEIKRAEIEGVKNLLVQIQTEIQTKEENIENNKPKIEEFNQELSQIESNLDQEINILQSQVVILGISVSRFIILIIIYWLIYQLIKFVTYRITRNEVARNLVQLITFIFAFGATILTILIAFINNLPILITSFGVISAAMVVALQEFISSFFAWFVIKARGPYKKGDLIQIQTNVEVYTGIVKTVGLFRTSLDEKFGGDGLDRERFTGKVIDFPNNMILRHPVKNFTKDNLILWNTMDIVITYESDHHIAKNIIKDSLDNYFKFAIENKKIFLDDIGDIETNYKPKIYTSLAGDGPCFTIWFPSRTGKLREVIERLSVEILNEFNVQGIDIAYKTSRVIPTNDFDKPARFVFGDGQ